MSESKVNPQGQLLVTAGRVASHAKNLGRLARLVSSQTQNKQPCSNPATHRCVALRRVQLDACIHRRHIRCDACEPWADRGQSEPVYGYNKTMQNRTAEPIYNSTRRVNHPSM